jgi:hypothetical protein
VFAKFKLKKKTEQKKPSPLLGGEGGNAVDG